MIGLGFHCPGDIPPGWPPNEYLAAFVCGLNRAANACAWASIDSGGEVEGAGVWVSGFAMLPVAKLGGWKVAGFMFGCGIDGRGGGANIMMLR
jgi:hypothetical protein